VDGVFALILGFFSAHLVSECDSFNTGIVCVASSSAHLFASKIFLLGVLSITHLAFCAGLLTSTWDQMSLILLKFMMEQPVEKRR